MPLIKGIDQPVRDFLSDLHHASQAGLCMVSDPRGIADPVTGRRYAYIIHPDSPTNAIFYRIDLESRAAEPLAALPAAAAGAYNFAIDAALYDPTGGAASDTPTVYAIVSITAAPWSQLMAYNIRTGAWAVLAAPALTAAAPFAISASLAHPCGTLGYFADVNAELQENHIWLSGNGGAFNAVAGPSNLAVYNKGANNWAYYLGAGAARAAAPAAGSKIVWLPNYPGSIISTRGGASPIWDVYAIATDTWAPLAALQPAINMNEGTELCTLYEAPGWIAVRPPAPGNQIFAVEAGNIIALAAGGPLLMVCQIDDSLLPLAHAQQALVAWWIAGGYYFGAIPYGRSSVKRIQVPMPL